MAAAVASIVLAGLNAAAASSSRGAGRELETGEAALAQGRALLEQGQSTQAIGALKRAFDSDWPPELARYRKATAAQLVAETCEAIGDLTCAEEWWLRHVRARSLEEGKRQRFDEELALGLFFLRVNKVEDAELHLSRALEVVSAEGPNTLAAVRVLGPLSEVYLARGQVDQAAELMRREIALLSNLGMATSPTSVDAYERCARILEAASDLEGAHRCREKAREIDDRLHERQSPE